MPLCDRNQERIQIGNQVQANAESQSLGLVSKPCMNYKQKDNSRAMESCEELFKINKCRTIHLALVNLQP